MKLSSDLTFISKFILPGFPLGFICLILPTAITKGGGVWILIGLLVFGLIAALIWSLPIKVVEIEGDHFSISNFRSTHLVPISNLFYFEEDRMNRTPSIMLHFDPPTPFGKSVKFIPPRGSLMKRMSAFDEICDWLKEVLKTNNADQSS